MSQTITRELNQNQLITLRSGLWILSQLFEILYANAPDYNTDQLVRVFRHLRDLLDEFISTNLDTNGERLEDIQKSLILEFLNIAEERGVAREVLFDLSKELKIDPDKYIPIRFMDRSDKELDRDTRDK